MSTSASQDCCERFMFRRAKHAPTRYSPYGPPTARTSNQHDQSGPNASSAQHQATPQQQRQNTLGMLRQQPPDVLANLAIHLCETSIGKAHAALHEALRCCCTSNDSALQDAALQRADQAMTRTLYRLGLAKQLVLAALPPGAAQHLQQLQQHQHQLQQLQLQLLPGNMPGDDAHSEDEGEEVSSCLRVL